MKRNMDLAKRILETATDCQDPGGVTRTSLIKTILGVENIAQATQDDRYIDLLHQLDLLTSAGFLLWHGRDPSSLELGDITEPTCYHVAWAGHDLLDSMR